MALPVYAAGGATPNPGLQQAFEPTGYSNPPPDPRLNSSLNVGVNKGLPVMAQGLMQQASEWTNNTGSVGDQKDPTSIISGQKFPYRLNFNYNPSDITVNYGLDTSITMPSQLTPGQLAASAIVPGMTSISFNLLFDRTYECWDGGNPAIKSRFNIDFRQVGVYADIGYFERCVGVITPGSPSNNMLPVPLVVLFGGGGASYSATNPGASLVPAVGLSFVGYVTSATVDYTHFTSQMVPVRAAMSITMSQLIGVLVGDAESATGTAAFKFGSEQPLPTATSMLTTSQQPSGSGNAS